MWISLAKLCTSTDRSRRARFEASEGHGLKAERDRTSPTPRKPTRKVQVESAHIELWGRISTSWAYPSTWTILDMVGLGRIRSERGWNIWRITINYPFLQIEWRQENSWQDIWIFLDHSNLDVGTIWSTTKVADLVHRLLFARKQTPRHRRIHPLNVKAAKKKHILAMSIKLHRNIVQ